MAFVVDGTAQFAFTQANDVDGSGAYLTMKNISTSEWVLDGTTLPWSGTIGAGSYMFKFWTDDLASMSGSNVHFSFVVGESTSTPVPEPATMLLLASGLVGLVGLRKRFKK